MRCDLPGHGGVTLSTWIEGPADGPPLLLLHGFPDLAQGWSRLLPLLTDRFRLYVPDLRGYGASTRPDGVASYHIDALLADLTMLIVALGAPVSLVGSDWGGVLGWCLADRRPDLVARLVAINAPHPFILNRALCTDPAQRAAAAYIQTLRQDGVETRLAGDDFALLFAALEEGQTAGPACLTPTERALYRTAWSRPGAIVSMVNWYRMADFVDPDHPIPAPDKPLIMPAQLIWGQRDKALLSALAPAHLDIGPGLDIQLLADQGHWPQRTAPAQVAGLIRGFMNRT